MTSTRGGSCLAWLYARAAGRSWPFYDAIVEARWGRADDICDPRVIAEAARTADLDPEATLTAADDPAVRAEAVDCLYAAYRDDIFGIPYLKWGHQRFWGLDRVDTFLNAWRPVPVVL